VGLKELTELCLKCGILASEEAIESLHEALAKKLKWQGSKANEFIAAYVDAFKERFPTGKPLVGGKYAGIAKRITLALGGEDPAEVCRTFFMMTDSWITQNGYDLVSFEQKLGAVMQRLKTGMSVGRVQAQQIERYDANRAALETYRARKKET
jgi:hypothetical protein